MRIRDWSSDVCSSDLSVGQPLGGRAHHADRGRRLWPRRNGAAQRYRHRLPHPVQADELDRAGDRGAALYAVGSRAEGRPFEPLARRDGARGEGRSEEHTSELQSLMRISYAVFRLKKKIKQINSLTMCT